MKTLESENDYCDVWVTNAGAAVCIQDETGDAVYLDKKQASQLLPLLQNFIETGELPE